MGNEASKVFERILDNSSDIVVEIRNEVYKLLGINSQNQQLTEYVQECLEKFAFNVVEKQFLEQIRSVVIDEINKNDSKLRNNESVDYNLFTSSIIEKLRQVKLGNISLDDDLKALADEIVDRYPQINVSRDQFYSHFSSKKEQITNMINKYNQDIVETLIKFTPQLSSELSNQAKTNQSPDPTPTSEQNIVSSGLSVDKFLSRCTQKLDEVNLMFKNGGNSKSEIAKGFRQLKGFIENLNDKTFAQSVLDRYTKLNEVAQGVIYDNIIFENVPMLREIYEKYDSLLAQSQVDELKNNLGRIFDSPVTTQEQKPINTVGAFPREPAISSVFGAEDNRAANLRELREMQERKEPIPVHAEEEKEEIRNQMQQAQGQLAQTLEWAKQQPNTPTYSTSHISDTPTQYPSNLYIEDKVATDYINSNYQNFGTVDKILSVSGYPDKVYEVRFSNGDTHNITITKEENLKMYQEHPKEEKTTDERKQQIIDNFINHYLWVYANEIKQSYYPYDMSQADISKDKDSLRGTLRIPAYPISDEEYDEIFNKLSDKVKEFVTQLILEDEKKRSELRNVTPSTPSSSWNIDGFGETKKEQVTDTTVTNHIQPQEEQKQSTISSQQETVNQENQMKNKLVEQIMSAMNTSGEMAFGDISFSERMYRISEIKNRLGSKSIEELQTLLSTYQEQSLDMEEQHSSSMRR